MPATTAADPVTLLKEDHKAVKELFDRFEQAKSDGPKKKAARQAIMELKVHAAIEEEIFYPAFDAEVQEKDSHFIKLEAEEEHHVVHVLIAELDKMRDDDEYFDAKFTVLAENVRHHIKEEETEMLPKAKAMGSERLRELGAQMAARKKDLTAQLSAA
jgi:hemerythrin-like domain-containing protein